MNILVVAVISLLGLSVFFGMIVGAIRGAKKSFIRLITLGLALVVGIIVSGIVIKYFGAQIVDWTSTKIDDARTKEILEFLSIHYKTFSSIIAPLIRPIVFFAVSVALWLVFLVFYWILAGIFGRRKRDARGDLKPKHGFVGMIIGIMCGIVFFMPLFITVNGYLRVASSFTEIEVEGKSIQSQLEEIDFLGFNIDIKEYNENSIINFLEIGGIESYCFDVLTTAELDGKKTVLSNEIVQLKALGESYNKLDTENILLDIDKLEAFTDSVLESRIASFLINKAIDIFADDPDLFIQLIGAGKQDSDDIVSEVLADKQFLTSFFEELRGNVKYQLAGCYDSIRIIKETGIDGFDMDSISKIDNENTEKLVNTIFDTTIIRNFLPIVAVELMQSVSDSIGIEDNFTRPELTNEEWINERMNVLKVFRSIGSLTNLLDLAEGTEQERMERIEGYFDNKQNINSMTSLMEGIRDSRLTNQLYSSITAFDVDKNEYFFITYLNDLVFGEQGSQPIQTIDGSEPEPSAKSKTLRPLFKQSDAIKQNGVTPEDSIDFEKVDWKQAFGGISNMVELMLQLKNAQDSNIKEMDKAVIETIKNVAEMDKEMVKDVLETFIPEDSNIVIPDLENVDLQKEAEIISDLFDYQEVYLEKKNNEETMEKEEVERIIDTVAESEFVLQILDSAGTTVEVSEQEKQWIEEKLESSDYPDEVKDAIRKLFESQGKAA